MAMSNLIEITIRDLGINGEGIGDHEGVIYFVPGALPEETVIVEPILHKKSYVKARIHTIVSSSKHRIVPSCRFFSKCGGCQIMHLDYARQLAFKRKRVEDTLHRIAKITDVEVEPCQPSTFAEHYRSKIQLPLMTDAKGILQLGLYTPRSHEIVPIDACKIHATVGEKILSNIIPLIRKSQLPSYCEKTQKGYLRFLVMRTNQKEGLLGLVTHGPANQKIIDLATEMMERSDALKGIIHIANSASGNHVIVGKHQLLLGQDHLLQQLGGISFRISLSAFFQVNTDVAEHMFAKALEMADIQLDDCVLDPYCGVGVFALLAAKKAQKTYGIEIHDHAIADAKHNAESNKISRAYFQCMSAELGMKQLQHVDIVFLNPPRKGCDPEVIREVLRLKPRRVVYMSCNPATLARDLAIMTDEYKIAQICPFDMFPHTMHVEVLASLIKK